MPLYGLTGALDRRFGAEGGNLSVGLVATSLERGRDGAGGHAVDANAVFSSSATWRARALVKARIAALVGA
jgi:hypothetical protein